MRVTTNMINEASQRAGLPLLDHSLLNQMNQTGRADAAKEQTLLSALSDKEPTAGSAAGRAYDKLEKSASGLLNCLEQLTGSRGSELLEQAKTEQGGDSLYQTMKELAQYYNETMNRLLHTSSPLDAFYRENLSTLMSESSDLLAQAGIGFSKSGEMTVDAATLRGADAETLESVFGEKAEWKDKLLFLADRILGNAESYRESLASQYGMNGSMTAYGSGRFDLLG